MVIATNLTPRRPQPGSTAQDSPTAKAGCQTNLIRYPQKHIKTPPRGSKGRHHGTFITCILRFIYGGKETLEGIIMPFWCFKHIVSLAEWRKRGIGVENRVWLTCKCPDKVGLHFKDPVCAQPPFEKGCPYFPLHSTRAVSPPCLPQSWISPSVTPTRIDHWTVRICEREIFQINTCMIYFYFFLHVVITFPWCFHHSSRQARSSPSKLGSAILNYLRAYNLPNESLARVSPILRPQKNC